MKENPNIEAYHSDRHIEELLNSFVDGELTQREQVEIQRLISHDARIARRLRELQKCKMLVGALPSTEAPAELAEEIKTSLQRKALLVQPAYGGQRLRERAGARHLLVRKVLAAAAMIGLVTVLGAVIYTIVAPESVPPATGFACRLELKTGDLASVDAVIRRSIEDNGLTYSSPRSRGDERKYALTCSQEDLNLLLADLENIWTGLDSTALIVGTEVFDTVTSKQVAEVVADLVTPPRPRLTSKEEIKEPVSPAKDKVQMHLTIVLSGSE